MDPPERVNQRRKWTHRSSLRRLPSWLEETAQQIVTEELALEEEEHVRDRGHAGVGDVTATGDFGEIVELAGVHHFLYLVRPKADYLDRTRLRVHEGAA